MVLWWPVAFVAKAHDALWMTDVTTRVFWAPNKAYTGGLLFLMFQSHLIFCDFLMVMRSIFICSGKWVIKLQKFTDFTFFTFLAA